jgi:hypothetical protein
MSKYQYRLCCHGLFCLYKVDQFKAKSMASVNWEKHTVVMALMQCQARFSETIAQAWNLALKAILKLSLIFLTFLCKSLPVLNHLNFFWYLDGLHITSLSFSAFYIFFVSKGYFFQYIFIAVGNSWNLLFLQLNYSSF